MPRRLIIQGVAGSGKTSVALHRMAYLLYRFKDTISSSQMMIISPNRVFSDYISNVLPELGEESILESGMEDIAEAELKGICRFQTFNEQAADLLESDDAKRIERIRFKSSAIFVTELDDFIRLAAERYFAPKDIEVDRTRIPKGEIANAYRASSGLPIKSRLEKTASVVAAAVRDEEGRRLPPSAVRKAKTAIRNMFAFPNSLALYEEFYKHLGKPELFKRNKTKRLEFEDVFPLLYVKIHLEGTTGFGHIQHLLVDEMQDYAPIQYAVLAKLFPCKKTILGDGSQSVNPYSSSTLAVIQTIFPEADTVELTKSYRSTLEIANFAQHINRNPKLIPVERHGEAPKVIPCGDSRDELEAIGNACRAFQNSEHRSLALICKTQKQAERLYERLLPVMIEIKLLDFGSERFHDGIVVTFAHMAKGLEFDRVIVPGANAATYRTELDRSLLYIACTRAMHALTVTYCGEPAAFLPG